VGIISISLDEDTEQKIGKIQEMARFKGRSELVRKAVQDLYNNLVGLERLTGQVTAVIVVRHAHDQEAQISQLTHEHSSVITAQLHNKIDSTDCVQVLHANGSSTDILKLHKDLKATSKTKDVRIIPQKQV
jgi:metal-responsive CopG/Arc/MetJ family transcriptional regulator